MPSWCLPMGVLKGLTLKLCRPWICRPPEWSSFWAYYSWTFQVNTKSKLNNEETVIREWNNIACFSIFFLCAGKTSGNKITPNSVELNTVEGDHLTLSCNYSSANSLQWCRQYPRSAPQFLLLIINPDKTEISDVQPRFSGRMNKERNQMFLDISSAKLSDSALYYCALRPTVKETGKLSYKNWHDVTWDDIHHTLLFFLKFCTEFK